MAHFNRLVPRRAAGHLETTHLDDDKGDVFDTLQCAHCGAHWVPIPGSGRARGFCLSCDGVTCGQRPCETRCVPYEKMIEDAERGG